MIKNPNMPFPAYPMDTLEHARRSRLQAMLDSHRGVINEETYKVVRERLDARVAVLEKEQRRGRGWSKLP